METLTLEEQFEIAVDYYLNEGYPYFVAEEMAERDVYGNN